ncbi:hypothetical protein VPH35_024802 [Triticum aestivum]
MTKHIRDMTELQVISHIAVSGDDSELNYVGYLLYKTSSVLRHLYHVTGNLRFLRSLGLKNGLPSWVEKLKALTKMTLRMTFITDDDFRIFRWLTSLSACRNAFQSLEFLDIECSAITCINFDNEACPNLKKLALSSTREQSLLGIELLPTLKKLTLEGIFDVESVEQAIAENKNNPTFVNLLLQD